ncbi:MAG: ABC transporter ATP-binding protein/permease [Eubacteriaceae bacterium]|nr:ABC transporter ATP-binding protein/permease [Eubacteriaceae bacterium]
MAVNEQFQSLKRQVSLTYRYFIRQWPTVFSLFAIIVLQVVFELTIPAVSANIVNIGISRGGIKDGSPYVMAAERFDSLLMYMPSHIKSAASELYYYCEAGQAPKGALAMCPGAAQRKVAVRGKAGEDKAFVYAFHIRECAEGNTGSVAYESLRRIFENLSPTGRTLLELDPQRFLSESNGSFQSNCFSALDGLDETALAESASEYIIAELRLLGASAEDIQSAYIKRNALYMAALAVAAMAAALAASYLASIVSSTFGRDLRRDMFAKALSLSPEEAGAYSLATLITRSSADVAQIQAASVMALRVLITAPILGFGAIAYAAFINFSLASIIVVFAAFVLFLIVAAFFAATPIYFRIQEYIDSLNRIARETLKGISSIRAFRREDRQEERLAEAANGIKGSRISLIRTMGILEPSMALSLNASIALIIWIGAHQVQSGTVRAGALIALVAYATQVIAALGLLANLSAQFSQALVSMLRVDEVLMHESKIADPLIPESFIGSDRGIVEFENVCFAYPGAEGNALSEVSFRALPQQTTAIVGGTGSGKSTIAGLIARLYEPSAGIVKVGGVDARNLALKELREEIGYVPQESMLFSGSIRTNIKFSNLSMPDEDMQMAASISQSTAFINEKASKYDEAVSEGGLSVSGGQRQRISISRALAKKPKVLVFDDCFSNLDYSTERKLRQAVKESASDATVIIISQRLSSIIEADQIVVLEEGRVIGIGSHESLMAECEGYRLFAASQLGEEGMKKWGL